jgi:hypothetical protein
MTIEDIRAKMEEINPNALTADGFDDCIVGYLEQCGKNAVFCYDAQKMAEKLASQCKQADSSLSDGDALEEAKEFLEFNTFGAYVGKNTPMWLFRFEE